MNQSSLHKGPREISLILVEIEPQSPSRHPDASLTELPRTRLAVNRTLHKVTAKFRNFRFVIAYCALLQCSLGWGQAEELFAVASIEATAPAHEKTCRFRPIAIYCPGGTEYTRGHFIKKETPESSQMQAGYFFSVHRRPQWVPPLLMAK
jgi:hypothetical protein